MEEYLSKLRELGIDTAPAQKIAADAVSFAAGTIVAKWDGFLCYWFLSQEDIVQENAERLQDGVEALPLPDVRQQRNDWFNYYYKDYGQANEAYKVLVGNDQFKPTMVFLLVADTTTAIVDEERLESMIQGFGPQIIMDLPVRGLRAGSKQFPAKNRHQYNLILQPMAVSAFADLLNIEHEPFDISELTMPEGDGDGEIQYTDELFERLFGDLEGGYDESVYWQRRAALWASLGEPDPKKDLMIGTLTGSDKPHKRCTTSAALSVCLTSTQAAWGHSLWAEVTMANDPMPGSVGENGRRWHLPVITRFFRSEEEARAAVEPEGSEGDGPPLPENYKGNREIWISSLKEAAGKPPAVAAEELYCEKSEVVAWREYLGIK